MDQEVEISFHVHCNISEKKNCRFSSGIFASEFGVERNEIGITISTPNFVFVMMRVTYHCVQRRHDDSLIFHYTTEMTHTDFVCS